MGYRPFYNCSVRLTWDVFVRNLNRQLGTPSHWLPVDSCKEGQKGALAAVCTPTLKSASKKHQKLCTSVSEHRIWHSEGVNPPGMERPWAVYGSQLAAPCASRRVFDIAYNAGRVARNLPLLLANKNLRVPP